MTRPRIESSTSASGDGARPPDQGAPEARCFRGAFPPSEPIGADDGRAGRAGQVSPEQVCASASLAAPGTQRTFANDAENAPSV